MLFFPPKVEVTRSNRVGRAIFRRLPRFLRHDCEGWQQFESLSHRRRRFYAIRRSSRSLANAACCCGKRLFQALNLKRNNRSAFAVTSTVARRYRRGLPSRAVLRQQPGDQEDTLQAERERNVLPDIGEGRARQCDQFGDAAECHVRTAAHGDTHRGDGKRRRVVDAIADHDDWALALIGRNRVELGVRQQLGPGFKTQCSTDSSRGAVRNVVGIRAARSPAWKCQGTPPDIYDVVLFGPGQQRVFARYRGSQEI